MKLSIEDWLAELETICNQLLPDNVLHYVSWDFEDWECNYLEGQTPEEAYEEVYGE